jgi:ABC-2 type transport system permease protein
VMFGAPAFMVAYRDLQRFWKYRWWLAGLIAMNLADLFIFAIVFRGIVRRDVIPDYFHFLAPGIASIAAFAAAFTIGREVMMELRRGFHHYLLSLPISRVDLVLGRILGGVVRGVIYQMPFLALLVILTGVVGPALTLALIVTIMVSASMSSLSIALSTAVKSLEMQATIRSITYFAIFFLSNVFYPENVLKTRFPEPLYTVIVNNPVSIATSIYRVIFTPEIIHDVHQVEVLLVKLALWTTILVVVGAILYSKNLKG